MPLKRSIRALWAIIGMVAITATLTVSPTPAQANSLDEAANPIGRVPSSSAVKVTTEVRDSNAVGVLYASCPSGTTRYLDNGQLTNGTLRAVFCEIDGTSRVKKIWVEYEKDSGPTVEVRVGWRNTTSGGSDSDDDFWGSFETVTMNQSVSTTWEFTYGINPLIDHPCWRGMMEDTGSGFWVTGHVCT